MRPTFSATKEEKAKKREAIIKNMTSKQKRNKKNILKREKKIVIFLNCLIMFIEGFFTFDKNCAWSKNKS